MMGLLQYLRDNEPEIIIVPQEVTKEMLERLFNDRPKRQEPYFLITPEMKEIMNRMIEQTPDGKWKIKR